MNFYDELRSPYTLVKLLTHLRRILVLA